MTAFLDLHPIYGMSDEENKELRTFEGGLLKVNKINGQDWFINSTNPKRDCPYIKSTSYCFHGGKRTSFPTMSLLYMKNNDLWK